MKTDHKKKEKNTCQRMNELPKKDYQSNYILKLNQYLSINTLIKVWLLIELLYLQINKFNRAVIRHKDNQHRNIFLYKNYILKNDTVIIKSEFSQTRFSQSNVFLLPLELIELVLLYESANLRYQALDIGHLTSSYEQPQELFHVLSHCL
ncbi:hypothetical protein FG877_13635 [Enterococcus casseliflavus]|nr:hypothetical protein [Enterococcus casseliflavus]